MIYLDNAASSHPKPLEVIRAVSRQLSENGANPGRSGHVLSAQASRTVFDTRNTLARFFGTQPEYVIFTANTTHAINLAIKGVLSAGDHAIISDLEHNSVLRPLTALRQRGVDFDVAKTHGDPEETVQSFRERLRSNTKLVVCTHASNVTGQILPVAEIGRMCREQGILFAVDGAQTAGVLRYDLENSPIDLLCIPGHKSLLAPQGTGALLLSREIKLQPLTEGGTGTESLKEDQPFVFPEGFESGTLNTPGIAGLNEGVRFVENHLSAIVRHEQNLRDLFVQELQKMPDYRILGNGDRFVPTVALEHVRRHSEHLADYLSDHGICVRGGFHCAALAHKSLKTEARGAVRISFGYRNTEQDVSECLKYLKKYLNN